MDTIIESMEVILNATAKDCNTEDAEELSLGNKIAFFNETRHAFGRSALLLSGGGSMGIYHSGVIKSLLQENLMPTVVSGASAGSIVAGMVAVRTDEELLRSFKPGYFNMNFFGTNMDTAEMATTTPRLLVWLTHWFPHSFHLASLPTVYYLVKRWLVHHYVFDIHVLKTAVRENIGDYTFREAYDRTGRIINITVTSSHSADYPKLLNYLTAPNVLIWSGK